MNTTEKHVRITADRWLTKALEQDLIPDPNTAIELRKLLIEVLTPKVEKVFVSFEYQGATTDYLFPITPEVRRLLDSATEIDRHEYLVHHAELKNYFAGLLNNSAEVDPERAAYLDCVAHGITNIVAV